MAISIGLQARARPMTGVDAVPFRVVADALEVIPRTLVQNAGGNAIHARTALRVRLFSSLSNVSLILYHFFCGQNMQMENIRGVSMVRQVISWT